MTFLSRQTLTKLKGILSNEHWFNVIRTSLTIIAPIVLFGNTGRLQEGVYIALGTLLVSLTDLPAGNRSRLSFLLLAPGVLAAVALVTTVFVHHSLITGLLITIFCFLFSMAAAYGKQANAIGSLALIMMIFALGLKPLDPAYFSGLILAGGIWYWVSTFVYTWVLPQKMARQAIRNCLVETAKVLRLKAEFYDSAIAINQTYNKVIPAHMQVNEKQELVRALLLDQKSLNNGDKEAQKLIRLAAEIIDLYEQILSIHHDYETTRKLLLEIGALDKVKDLIIQSADEIRAIGDSINNRGFGKQTKSIIGFNKAINELRFSCLHFHTSGAELLRTILMNLENIRYRALRIQEINGSDEIKTDHSSIKDALLFADYIKYDWKPGLNHLNFQSPIFRFATRLSAACLAAYLFNSFVLSGKYDYWLLLTIVIIARPSFGTTWRRNLQRIGGSIAGIALAFTLLQINLPFIDQVVLVGLFLTIYLGFLYINYLVSVICITCVAIIGLHLLGGNNEALLTERSYTALLGGAIATLSAFIFPFWESRQIKGLIKESLMANIDFLDELKELTSFRPVNMTTYRLKRKQVFVSTANLYRAHQNVLAEPKKGKIDHDLFHQFQVLNHELYALTSSLFHARLTGESKIDTHQSTQTIQCAISYLNDGLRAIAGKFISNKLSEPCIYIAHMKIAMNGPAGQLYNVSRRAAMIYEHTLRLIHLQQNP